MTSWWWLLWKRQWWILTRRCLDYSKPILDYDKINDRIKNTIVNVLVIPTLLVCCTSCKYGQCDLLTLLWPLGGFYWDVKRNAIRKNKCSPGIHILTIHYRNTLCVALPPLRFFFFFKLVFSRQQRCSWHREWYHWLYVFGIFRYTCCFGSACCCFPRKSGLKNSQGVRCWRMLRQYCRQSWLATTVRCTLCPLVRTIVWNNSSSWCNVNIIIHNGETVTSVGYFFIIHLSRRL